MLLRAAIVTLGLSLLVSIIWGLNALELDIVVNLLAVIGLYSSIYAVSNATFIKEYRDEVRIRRDGR